MNIDNKINEIETYMLRTESQLQIEIRQDLRELNSKRNAIEAKYESLKQEATKRCQCEKEQIQLFCARAKTLVEGVRRKLFKKQQRAVTITKNDIIQDPQDVLADLEREVGKFDTTSLPYGLRQLLDSVALLFNSNYGQAEVDRIVELYHSVLRIQENGELDQKLNAELSKLEQSQMREIYSIDRAMTSIVEEQVESYIYKLNQMIFTT